MPEVKASPATPDKSLSHSRYSLATHRDLENMRLGGYIRQGLVPSARARRVISPPQDAVGKQEEL
jgi:hypothetical protein